MSFDQEKLYELIPAVYRLKDEAIAAATGEDKGPLKAFIELFGEQIALLENNLDQLYDDQFIETCAEWVVPYIGDLVGAKDLLTVPDAGFSQRAQVANTLAYRRRKGTASVIEQLAQDITGWPANIIEYFQKLSTTQYINHLRPQNIATVAIRANSNSSPAYLSGTPFDTHTRTVDVRNISSRRGKYNIPNLGVFLWRIAAQPITRSRAYKIDENRFTFDCIGRDAALYHFPDPEENNGQLAGADHVPMPISRMRMHKKPAQFYGPGGRKTWLYNIPVSDIAICNLSDDSSGGWFHTPATKITIDPELGRIAFPPGEAPEKLFVNYYYGSFGKTGSGEFIRETVKDKPDENSIRVPGHFATIQEALTNLPANGVIELTDNDYYIETPQIHLQEGQKITIKATGQTRPVWVLNGDLNIIGSEGSELTLDGIFVVGGCIRVPATSPAGFLNECAALTINYCTLLPAESPAIETVPAQPVQPRIKIETNTTVCTIKNSISGALVINENAGCTISDSIIDAADENKWAYKGMENFGGQLTIINTTVIGKVSTTLLNLASNSIFLSGNSGGPPVASEKTQQGCARYCYVPPGSVVTKKFKCQPEAVNDATRMRPVFNSVRFGDPSYCQLNEHCAKEILQGADNESEMGVYNRLYQFQRISDLQRKLNEYLRFGLEAGIFFGS